MNDKPEKIILSLGAGVQSTTLLLLSANGALPKPDYALFSDTGGEPQFVYDHLDKLNEQVAKPAGIELVIVSAGNLTERALDHTKGGPDIPVHLVDETTGKRGMLMRACTVDYKVNPIKRKTRQLLGAKTSKSGSILQPPAGVWAEQWIGISTDEFHRAKDADVKYVKNKFPLLDLNWSREDCVRYLKQEGWGTTPKSACFFCPFHSNKEWRFIRDNHPDTWQQAVEFDEALRAEPYKRLRNTPYLHTSLTPLKDANIDKVSAKEWKERQSDILDELEISCSPFACVADEQDVEWIETK